jgi:GH18 family chitinase
MAMASDPAKRQRFVEEANALCDKYGLDGLDLDWEHPKTPAEATAYGDLIQALRTAFRPKGRVVTAAIASWQSMSIEAVSGLDRVHLMSYDHQGRHATMDHAREDVRKLVAMGFPAKKIVLGVPFYGRNLAKWDDAKSYAEILTAFKPSPGDDEAGGYYFNGRKTLQEKAAFAKEKGLGGVMAWEVTHDASGRASLAGALRQALDKR